jgi:hypothetical protein
LRPTFFSSMWKTETGMLLPSDMRYQQNLLQGFSEIKL